jgi:hypothetical protein
MIKINRKDEFDFWHGHSNKHYIISNDGIGDLLICANFASYYKIGVAHISEPNYRKEFAEEYCRLINVPYFFCNSTNDVLKNKIKNTEQYKKTFQFKAADRIVAPNKIEILKSIYLKNHGFVKKNNNNDNDRTVMICPNGSNTNNKYVIRSMDKVFVNDLVKDLKFKNYKIYFVGIEKDIEKYGFYENCAWINTKKIIHNAHDNVNISMIDFFNIIANSCLSITVPTSFHCLSNMLCSKTLTLHRYDYKNRPIIKNDSYLYFFANRNYYSNGIDVDYAGIKEYVSSLS